MRRGAMHGKRQRLGQRPSRTGRRGAKDKKKPGSLPKIEEPSRKTRQRFLGSSMQSGSDGAGAVRRRWLPRTRPAGTAGPQPKRNDLNKKKPGSHLLSRREGTIIGAGELDFRVRDGNGYCLSAMAAGQN